MFTYLMITGFIVLFYCVFRQRHLIRVEWDSLAKFLAFMSIVTAIRFAIISSPLQGFMPPFTFLPMVVWEDYFFAVLGIYFFKDYLKLRKLFWVPIAIIFSLTFALGHISYGLLWACMTLFYPYFISYRYGKIYGFGTVACAHVLYDFITLLTVKLIALFSLMKGYGI